MFIIYSSRCGNYIFRLLGSVPCTEIDVHICPTLGALQLPQHLAILNWWMVLLRLMVSITNSIRTLSENKMRIRRGLLAM